MMLIQHDLKCLGPVVANFHVLPMFVFSYLDFTALNLLFKLQLELNTDGWIYVLSARKATSLLMSCVYCVWSLEHWKHGLLTIPACMCVTCNTETNPLLDNQAKITHVNEMCRVHPQPEAPELIDVR